MSESDGRAGEAVVLDIGCGGNRAADATFGVDIIACPGVDVVCNFERSLPFADGSVDRIITRHTLEHVANLEQLLREFVRVLKPGGRLRVVVPHFSNTLGFSDYTHRRFFGYYTFDYFSRRKSGRWAVPNYTNDIWFRIVSKRLCFRNLSVFGTVMDRLINRSESWAYFYESKLSWFISCFEIEFELEVDQPTSGG